MCILVQHYVYFHVVWSLVIFNSTSLPEQLLMVRRVAPRVHIILFQPMVFVLTD